MLHENVQICRSVALAVLALITISGARIADADEPGKFQSNRYQFVEYAKQAKCQKAWLAIRPAILAHDKRAAALLLESMHFDSFNVHPFTNNEAIRWEYMMALFSYSYETLEENYRQYVGGAIAKLPEEFDRRAFYTCFTTNRRNCSSYLEKAGVIKEPTLYLDSFAREIGRGGLQYRSGLSKIRCALAQPNDQARLP